MFQLSPSVRIFVSTKPADMRRSFDGLLALARSHFDEDPNSGSLFIFRSSRGNLVKILWWDCDGFALFSKRLEAGTFRFPEVRFVNGSYEPAQIDRSELLMLLEGIDTSSVKRLKRYKQRTEIKGHRLPQKSRIRGGECANTYQAMNLVRRQRNIIELYRKLASNSSTACGSEITSC